MPTTTRRQWRLTALVATASACLVAPMAMAASESSAGTTPSVEIRVNQQGYLPKEPKVAWLMASAPLSAQFQVRDANDQVVFSRSVPTKSAGSWNASYPYIYRLNLSDLTSPGTYHVVTYGAVQATSPAFEVAGATELLGDLEKMGVRFDQVQRDGSRTIEGSLDRHPSHLRDRRAVVYARPKMDEDGVIQDADLRRIGGPVDVEGGWSDAGDYLKFTSSSSYNVVALLTSARLLGRKAPTELLDEARHGTNWLNKMWDRKTDTLHIQVGIGVGDKAGTFIGDHDRWRLPEGDDNLTGKQLRYLRNRPVFDAAQAGKRISPNLAGRVSAALALAAQADARSHPARARDELRRAQRLYHRAQTTHPPKTLVTALPHSFYPELTWYDDMALGGAEIARARIALGMRPHAYVRSAAKWASHNIKQTEVTPRKRQLNLYDVSALADASLIELIRQTKSTGLKVTVRQLAADLRGQLKAGERASNGDIFGASQDLQDFDVSSKTFGQVTTAYLYQRLTHDNRFARYGATQRAWILGANPWGMSAMIGVGTRFPMCPQHQIANLNGSHNGTPPVLVGAVVNGPNAAEIFDGLDQPDTSSEACSVDDLKDFDGQGSRWVDDVRSWQSVEPALDMTAAAILAGSAGIAAERVQP